MGTKAIRGRTLNNTQRVGFLAIFVAIGVALLLGAHAATVSKGASVATKTGTLAGGASVVADSGAINGQAVQFAGNSTGTTTTSADDPGHFGMALGSGYQAFSATELNSYFADMEAIGVQWVRFDIEWAGIQSGSGSSYNWTAY